ncbi:pyridoxamine 5'-phosphate oxidase family protein [Streptomyces coryli]|uniref:pyridoxamine 5'-phosphate oxidase family protein n=1 Tax=Streptomyces coryli TaxID=1128680 RepID=UPI0030B91367
MDRTRPGRVRTVQLSREEALRLLGSVTLGRIVFTQDALPAIRPVNHALVAGEIFIRMNRGSALTLQSEAAGADGVVIAYEADDLDPDTHLGWSVVVTGYARLITGAAELARLRGLVHPWTDRELDLAVRIRPEVVTGMRLERGTDETGDQSGPT